MRIFLTGATGFIGSAITQELLRANHQVLGLARSDAAAKSLTAAGATPHPGDLENLDALRSAAATSDAVIHTAFIHDFSKFQENCNIDRRAIQAIGDALAGSNRPFVISSGTALISPGRLATEETTSDHSNPFAALRGPSEDLALSFAPRGVRAPPSSASPTVHGDGDHGFVPLLIKIAREKGASAYIGDGQNRWPAVHRFDAATLYRLAIENAPAASTLHAIAEEAIPFRKIAEAIGKGLHLPVVSKSPEEAPAHFGWFSTFAAIDAPASSALTRQRLGWHPTGPTLLTDLEKGTYFTESSSSS